MTKAGAKLINAMKEAAKTAKCQHRWERISTRVKDRMVTGTQDECPKCGAKRWTWNSGPIRAATRT